jgi:hypothetical protein
VTISKDDTIILDGGGDKSAIEARCEQIRDSMENASSDYDRYMRTWIMSAMASLGGVNEQLIVV